MQTTMISWERLDAMTLEEIVAALRANDIKGRQAHREYCPLGRATGWRVGAEQRRTFVDGSPVKEPLTDAEKDFVLGFDMGTWPDLIDCFAGDEERPQ